MSEQIRLTRYAKRSGCGAKLGPQVLERVLQDLPVFEDRNLLVGFEHSDDAAVYRVSEDLAMIQTLDFFPPIVDDPYTYGQIAAANALSDVYAMGGEPKVALNIVGFPSFLPVEVLKEILAGGADKVKETGAVLVGGHSINNEEPLYGLAVSGFVDPARVWKNAGARPGDMLILTKQIGSGVISTSIKGELAPEESVREAIKVMSTLNKDAARVLKDYDVHAATDVTGFSLIGHSLEMAGASGVSIRLFADRVPFIRGARELAESGLVPSGAYRNRAFAEGKVDHGHVSRVLQDLLYDPQTSGGLLVSIRDRDVPDIMHALAAQTQTKAAVVGSVHEAGQKSVYLI